MYDSLIIKLFNYDDIILFVYGYTTLVQTVETCQKIQIIEF